MFSCYTHFVVHWNSHSSPSSVFTSPLASASNGQDHLRLSSPVFWQRLPTAKTIFVCLHKSSGIGFQWPRPFSSVFTSPLATASNGQDHLLLSSQVLWHRLPMAKTIFFCLHKSSGIGFQWPRPSSSIFTSPLASASNDQGHLCLSSPVLWHRLPMAKAIFVCLHQSSDNCFQWRTLPLIWVPNSSCDQATATLNLS
jgi:hypothetical protein